MELAINESPALVTLAAMPEDLRWNSLHFFGAL